MLKFVRRNQLFTVGGTVLALLAAIAVLAGPVAPYDPVEMSIMNMLSAPSSSHPFGTDEYGRDVLSRVIFGARISLIVGLSVAFLSGVVGTTIGLVAGYFKPMDNPLMRVMDAMMAVPEILLALAIVAALGPSLVTTIVALTVAYIPRTARVVRAGVLSITEREYIQAAQSLGMGSTRILWRHVLINCMAPLTVQQSFIFAYAVLAEAALSFLGVGPPPPTPSWGNIMSEARTSMAVAPWVMFFPGIAVVITVLSINTLGDGLRDLTDPKQ